MELLTSTVHRGLEQDCRDVVFNIARNWPIERAVLDHRLGFFSSTIFVG